MSKIQPPPESNEPVHQAYASSLEKALMQSKQSDAGFHASLDDIHRERKTASKSSILDDAIQLEQAIKRDLIAAAQYMNDSGSELKDWLGFDLKLIKNELWKNFTEATDKTTLELLKLKQIAENAQYHTGEIVGLGTLVCDECQATLHFHQPGHIPPCAKCHGTRFHRQHYGV